MVRETLPVFFLIILSACSVSRQTSMLYNESYDKESNRTTITMFPFGVVKLPGVWTKTREFAQSGQYFYLNEDSVQVAIAMHEWNNIEFSHQNPNVTTLNFVRKFYEWESNYFKEITGREPRIVKEDTQKNYLIWHLMNGTQRVDYFLFGLKGNTAFNLNVKASHWDEEKKVRFLEQMFLE